MQGDTVYMHGDTVYMHGDNLHMHKELCICKEINKIVKRRIVVPHLLCKLKVHLLSAEKLFVYKFVYDNSLVDETSLIRDKLHHKHFTSIIIL